MENLDNEPKLSVYDAICKDRESGMSIAAACQKHGVSLSVFYSWKNKQTNHMTYKKRAKRAIAPAKPAIKPYAEYIEVPETTKPLVCIIGDAIQISDVIRSIK